MLSRLLGPGLGPMPLAAWAALTAFAALLFGVNLGGSHVLTDHEILVGGVARQMAEDGTWYMLFIGDHPWLEKPPLPHWLAALSGLAWGSFTEFTVRFPFAIAGVAAVLLVAWQSARWFGATVGLLSGLTMASSVYLLKYARLSEVDVVLLLLVAGALISFWHLQNPPAERPARRLPRILFWGCLGATFLTKGPFFGAAIIGVTVVGWLLLRWEWAALRRLWSPAGIALALVLVALWPAMVAAAGHGEVLWDEWVMHVVDRGRGGGAFSGHMDPWWFYGPAVLWQLLPWTPLVFVGAVPSLKRAWQDRASPDRLLWCWALLPPLLLSFAAFKSAHYAMSALPAFAPVIALGLVKVGDWLRAMSETWRGRLAMAGLAAAGAFLVGGGVAGFVWPEFWAHIWWPSGIVAVALAAGSLLLRRGLIAGNAAAVFLAVLAIGVVLRSDLVPRRDPSGPDHDFLMQVADLVPAEARLVATGGTDIARFVFYIDRPMTTVWSPADVATVAPEGTPFFVLTRAREAPALQDLGSVMPVAQSERARFERAPRDRYTLYRIDPDDQAP